MLYSPQALLMRRRVSMVRSLGPDRRRPSRSVLLAVSTMPRKPRSASARPRAEHLTAKRMGGPTKLTQPLHMIASPVGGSAGAPTPAMQIQTPCSTASKTTATIAARSYFGRRLPRSLLTPPLQQEGFLPHQLLHRPRRRISHHQHTNHHQHTDQRRHTLLRLPTSACRIYLGYPLAAYDRHCHRD